MPASAAFSVVAEDSSFTPCGVYFRLEPGRGVRPASASTVSGQLLLTASRPPPSPLARPLLSGHRRSAPTCTWCGTCRRRCSSSAPQSTTWPAWGRATSLRCPTSGEVEYWGARRARLAHALFRSPSPHPQSQRSPHRHPPSLKPLSLSRAPIASASAPPPPHLSLRRALRLLPSPALGRPSRSTSIFLHRTRLVAALPPPHQY